MRKFLILAALLAATVVYAQPANPSITQVASAPSGSCMVTLPLQLKTPDGTLYSCQNGTWGTVGGGGGGTPGGVAGNVQSNDGAGGFAGDTLLNYLNNSAGPWDYSCFGFTAAECAIVEPTFSAEQLLSNLHQGTTAFLGDSNGAGVIQNLVSQNGTDVSAPLAVVDGEPIATIRVGGYDGTQYLLDLVDFAFSVDGTVSTGTIPLQLQLSPVTQFTIGTLWEDPSKIYNGLDISIGDDFYNPASSMIYAHAATAGGTFSVAPDGTVATNAKVVTPAVVLSSTYSVAGTPLPACASGTLLHRVAVTDSVSATPGTAYTGSGTYTIAVECIFNSTGSAYSWIVD